MPVALAANPEHLALLICDYRPRGGEDGIAVIRRLQQNYNDKLPTLVVAGDTAPGNLLDAKAVGPVLPHKLAAVSVVYRLGPVHDI